MVYDQADHVTGREPPKFTSWKFTLKRASQREPENYAPRMVTRVYVHSATFPLYRISKLPTALPFGVRVATTLAQLKSSQRIGHGVVPRGNVEGHHCTQEAVLQVLYAPSKSRQRQRTPR